MILLCYLKKPSNQEGLDGYCGSDWASYETNKSTAGNFFRHIGYPIGWKSKLQRVSLSRCQRPTLNTNEGNYCYYSTLTASVPPVQVCSFGNLYRDLLRTLQG